jgi:TadE-like protein
MIEFCSKIMGTLRRCQKGAAAIEMALVSPIIIMIILATSDLAIYLVAHQRVSRAAYTVSNLMAQMDEGLTESQVSDLMLALNEVSQPFDLSTDGRATVTAIIGVGVDGSVPDSYEVAWQRCFGNSTIVGNSIFGIAGSSVSSSVIPDNTIATTSQIMVATEVTYNFTPFLGFLDLGTEIKYSSYFRPRLGSIANIVDDGSTSSAC